jgi:hypothetical protein
MTKLQLKADICSHYNLAPKQVTITNSIRRQVRLSDTHGNVRAWVATNMSGHYQVKLHSGWLTPEDAIQAVNLIEVAADIIKRGLLGQNTE